MRRELGAVALAALLLDVACGGPPARSPGGSSAALPGAFAKAFQIDATGDANDAVKAYADVVRTSAATDGDVWQVPALEGALDALTRREMPALADGSRDAALAYRTADGGAITKALGDAEGAAQGPFARGLIARGLGTLAQRRGDAADAEKQRAASGCVRDALVLGPTTWAPVTGVDEADPLDRADARIEAAYAGPGAFQTAASAAHPVAAHAQGCTLALSQESWRPGVRDVVVDVDVPHAQTVGLVLRARGAAVLRAGGTVVARRPFELGDGEAARFVRVAVTGGTLRLIARVGTAKDDDGVELDAFGDDGMPLVTHVPAIGSTAAGRVSAPPAELPAAPKDADQTLLFAAGAMASGSPREAERMLWGVADRPDARPDLALIYARAVDSARDLSPATRAERERSACERVLEAWPTSWEATLEHAILAGVRKGHDEAGIESLRDLDTLRAKTPATAPALLDAFEAITAGNERLFDRAHAALDRARHTLARTALLADAEDAVVPRVGAELVASSCDPARASAHDTLPCLDALRATGDRAAEWRELARLRALLGAPRRFLALELRDAGDDTALASRAFAAMTPAERTLAGYGLLAGGLDGKDARARLLQLALTARDAPGSLDPLLRATGDDVSADLDATAEKLATQDRAAPLLPSSATAVLAHTERYEITADGLLHWLLFDVRRVSGTTDVECSRRTGASSSPTARRTPRRTTPTSRSSSRATPSRPSTRGGRCRATPATWASTRPTSCPSAPRCTTRPSSCASRARCASASGATRSSGRRATGARETCGSSPGTWSTTSRAGKRTAFPRWTATSASASRPAAGTAWPARCASRSPPSTSTTRRSRPGRGTRPGCPRARRRARPARRWTRSSPPRARRCASPIRAR
jgi:hypothetical protein